MKNTTLLFVILIYCLSATCTEPPPCDQRCEWVPPSQKCHWDICHLIVSENNHSIGKNHCQFWSTLDSALCYISTCCDYHCQSATYPCHDCCCDCCHKLSTCSEITINVTYSHNITTDSIVSVCKSLNIVASKDVVISLKGHAAGISFEQQNQNEQDSFLHIKGITFKQQPDQYSNMMIAFNNFNRVQMDSVKFNHIHTVVITDTEDVNISNSVFSLDSTLSINGPIMHLLLDGNNFTTSTILRDLFMATFMNDNFNVAVNNCRFINNFDAVGRISIRGSGSVTISNCHFVQTILTLLSFTEQSSQREVELTFSHNTGQGLIFNTGFTTSDIHYNFTTFKVHNNTKTTNYPLIHIIAAMDHHYLSFNEVNVSCNNVSSETAIMFLDNLNKVSFTNCTFAYNHGTSLHVQQSFVYFNGYIDFKGNHGYQGGGMSLYGDSNMSFCSSARVSFEANTALHGNDMYIASNLALDTLCLLFTALEDNHTIGPNDIYFENSTQVQNYLEEKNDSCPETFIRNFSTSPLIYNNIMEPISVFPGQNITLDIDILDANNHTTYCNGNVELSCDDEQLCTGISLEGVPHLYLTAGKHITELYLIHDNESIDVNVTLLLSCSTFENQIEVEVTLSADCPLGYFLNQMVCDCIDMNGVVCARNGQACYPKGKWLQVENKTQITSIVDCHSFYCNNFQSPCPFETVDRNTYVLATSYQCINHHGGIMCMDCKDGYYLTYEAFKCVDHCPSAGPGVVFFFVLLFQILLPLPLILVLKGTVSNGAGGLYGPLFYLAVLNELPFSSFNSYSNLYNFITVVISFVSLDMKMFGILPVCSFENLGRLSHLGFHFMGPILTSSILLLVTAIVWVKYRKHDHLSPQLTIALLLLLLYWNFISTGLSIMDTVDINGEKRVAVQPDLKYFSSLHSFLWSFSFIAMAFLYFPLILLITFSKILSKKANLSRFKFFFQFYQGCYQERYNWYPVVYFTAFFIIALSKYTPLVQQITIIGVLSLQYILSPYHFKWMNISDTIFLINLFFVTSLLYQQQVRVSDSNDVGMTFFVYFFIVCSLLYIIVGGLSILMYRLGWLRRIDQKLNIKSKLLFLWKKINKQRATTTTSTHHSRHNSIADVAFIDGATTGYREPLLNFMNSSGESITMYGIQQ